MIADFRSVACLGVALLFFAACSVGGAPSDVPTECESRLELPSGISTDILFVIDDSASMREEQEKVVAQLGTFVDELLNGPVAHDFQVGVITTGVTQHFAFCDPEAAPILDRLEEESGALQGGVLHYRDADFQERFGELVRQGIQGSGQEMGLEAMRLALQPKKNPGFLRDGSRLLVVIVSDEDDCSDPTATALTLRPACEERLCSSDAECGGEGDYCIPSTNPKLPRSCQPNVCETPEGRALLGDVGEYAAFLEGLGREVFLAVIGAVDEEGVPARCMSGDDEAWGVGTRYREIVDLLGDNARIDSICASDYGKSLQEIARLVNVPHTLEVRQPIPDPRLLVVELQREDGERQRCTLGNGFEWIEGKPDRVALEGDCRLRHGDRIAMKLFCSD